MRMKKLALRQPSKSVRNEEVFKIRETPIELEGYSQQLQNLHNRDRHKLHLPSTSQPKYSVRNAIQPLRDLM